jgi:hypothetical protein
MQEEKKGQNSSRGCTIGKFFPSCCQPENWLSRHCQCVSRETSDRKLGSYPQEFVRVCNLTALPASELNAVLAVT